MELIACDVHLTRHRAVVTVNLTEFNVTSHTLARYMQRHRKSPTHFLSTIIRPLRLSTLLSPGQAERGIRRMILPINGGLLVGSLSSVTLDEDEELLFPIRVVYDKNGSHDEDADFSAPQVGTWMKTYIDRDSLNRRQQGILDAIEQWEVAHRRGIEVASQAIMFGNARLEAGDSLEKLKDDVYGAAEGCRLLIDSPEWQYLEA